MNLRRDLKIFLYFLQTMLKSYFFFYTRMKIMTKIHVLAITGTKVSIRLIDFILDWLVKVLNKLPGVFCI